MPHVIRRLATPTVCAITLLLGACGSHPDPWGTTTPSQIEGAVVTSSFPGHALAFTAEDETGHTESAPLGPSGAFVMNLPSEHHYRLGVETDRGSVRVVFPRVADRIDGAFALTTTQARIALGSIRYVADPATQPVIAATSDCTDGTRADGSALCSVTAERSECIDGYRSASPGTCSDLDLVLGYGSLPSLVASGAASGSFAIAAQSPPCEVQGCYVPDPPSPPSPTAD